jgi:hypothetical protein
MNNTRGKSSKTVLIRVVRSIIIVVVVIVACWIRASRSLNRLVQWPGTGLCCGLFSIILVQKQMNGECRGWAPNGQPQVR